MRRAFFSLVVLFVAAATRATAQATPIDTRNAVMHGEFVVKTVPLHHLTSNEAVKLLAPYWRPRVEASSRCRRTFAP